MQTPASLRIALIGLGLMGEPMARRLLAAEYPVTVFDQRSAARERFADTAAHQAASGAEAVENADVVILMLPESDAVEEFLFETDGAASAIKTGALVINATTGDLNMTMSQADRLTAAGCKFVDAPVLRTRHHAWRGELLAVVGATETDFEAARSILEPMASDIEHVGPPGSGLKLKLVNNYLGMVGMAMTAEALALADRLGLDRDLVFRCVSTTSAGRGQLLSTYPNKVLKGDLSADFPIAMGRKDLNLGLTVAEEVGSPRELGLASRTYFEAGSTWQRDEQDCTGLLLVLHEMANDQGGHSKK